MCQRHFFPTNPPYPAPPNWRPPSRPGFNTGNKISGRVWRPLPPRPAGEQRTPVRFNCSPATVLAPQMLAGRNYLLEPVGSFDSGTSGSSSPCHEGITALMTPEAQGGEWIFPPFMTCNDPPLGLVVRLSGACYPCSSFHWWGCRVVVPSSPSSSICSPMA